jgi:hypothetical protein
MPEQSALQPLAFDVGPAVKLYMDSVEAWRKNYERVASQPKTGAPDSLGEIAVPSYDKILAVWQKTADDAFRRFVERQIELCRFFEGRWEQYLHLQDRMARCRRPGELGQAHADFFERLAHDYMEEANKLTRSPMH